MNGLLGRIRTAAAVMMLSMLAACSGGGGNSDGGTGNGTGNNNGGGAGTGSPSTPSSPAPQPPATTMFTLSASVSGPGSISTQPAGIDCGATCSADYVDGTSVTLTATPAANAVLRSWSGACSGTAATCTLTVQSAISVSAQFDPLPPLAGTCTSVTQSGIVFTFDRDYRCGTFANGDYWVTPDSAGGSVTLTAISPDFTGTQNGWQVNPSNPNRQGFDQQGAGFDASLVPSLPYVAHGGESIVKAISFRKADQRTFVKTAAVLTVLSAVPADNGAGLFRPPYFGTDKPLYAVSSLRLDRLPRLAPTSNAPTLSSLQGDYRGLRLDYMSGWSAHLIFPSDNMPFYGGDIAIDNTVAALRLMLDDSEQAKRPLAIDYVQYGIDVAASRRGGQHFKADGGHRHGRKLLLSLTALLLADENIGALVHDAPSDTYQEDGQLYYSTTAGRVLWGKACSESDYWYNQNNPGHGSADCRDPYGYIDGGDESGQAYQFCCTAKAYAAIALALRLMPELQCIWNDDRLLQFADRWVTFGAWSQPDPYAPHGNGAPDNNPADGTGRWPANHGRFANQGYYSSPFADAMWVKYRASVPPSPQCPAS